MKWYFTYDGGKGQPYKGGWTEVEADTEAQAVLMYKSAHPGFGSENYRFIYGADSFEAHDYAQKGHCGRFCVERIALKVDVLDRAAKKGR